MKRFGSLFVPLLSLGLLAGCGAIPHDGPDPAHTLPYEAAPRTDDSAVHSETHSTQNGIMEPGVAIDRPGGSAMTNLDDPNHPDYTGPRRTDSGYDSPADGPANDTRTTPTWESGNRFRNGYQSYGSRVDRNGGSSGSGFDASVEPEHRVHFDFNSALITEETARTLTHNALWLRTRVRGTIIIEGHCDERGTREYNLALGQQRAEAVRNFLISQGMDANQLKTISYGKERPLETGHNRRAWSKNRRAEIILP